jgi:hypothetical protein
MWRNRRRINELRLLLLLRMLIRAYASFRLLLHVTADWKLRLCLAKEIRTN